jgi:hypothetical protein
VRRPGIVALDATTGTLGRVFVAGTFRQVHGVDRNQFAVLDAASAALLPAQLPVALIDPAIQAIATAGQRIYLYGGCRDNGFVSCAYTLDLDPLPTAIRYVLDVGTQSGATNIGSLPTGHLDTTLTTPAPSGTYFVRVRVVNVFGSSAATNAVQVVVP